MRINKNGMKEGGKNVIHYDGEQNFNKTNKWGGVETNRDSLALTGWLQHLTVRGRGRGGGILGA